MNKRVPFPKRYWVYVIILMICSIFLFVNIYRTDSWTGDKQFSEFTPGDWHLFAVFLVEEIVIVCIIVLFALLASRIIIKRNTIIAEQREQNEYLGINPGDYDYVWFDFWNTERALIVKRDDKYYLYVQEYDERTEEWKYINGVSVYDDLEKMKWALFDEFDFFCEQNAELDEHGDVKMKDMN